MYMNKRQIISAYNKGYIDSVAKQLRTYGQIVADKAWDEASGYYAGAHRVMKINHHGHAWRLAMWNGEVRELGYSMD